MLQLHQRQDLWLDCKTCSCSLGYHPRLAEAFALIGMPDARAAHDRGEARVISDRHFAVQLNHFIPGFLSYSVAVFPM